MGSLGVMFATAIIPCAAQDVATDAPATNAPSATMADTIKSLLTESSKDLAEGDYESAIRDASTAIQLDPQNASAYELRASVYIQEKLWDRAERDYLSASKLSPDVVYKYKLADIKFMAKSYEDARSRFAALEGDEHLGDLATYKAFLCDLLGFHDAAAKQDLAVMDAGNHTAAFYYSHAAWALYHNDRAEAGKYFAAADQLYGQATSALYVASLLQSRRFLLTTVSFATKDGTIYKDASVFLENDGLRISTQKGWITLPLDQLPDDLSAFPEELREQIDRKKAIAPDGPVPASLVTFTTRSGKAYDHVRWVVDDKGLSVLTPNGWIAVPATELPEDHSSFPDELQHALALKQASPAGASNRTEVVSFTTTRGKKYDDAKVFLTDDGLSVLTAQGWIIVPFRELPADISMFPAGWRTQIEAGRGSMADSTGVNVVTFTTTSGKAYANAKAVLARDGLRVLTSGGWMTVPYRQLPADVSVFPEVWRSQIEARRKLPAGDPSGLEVISFTTKLGKHYDQVRAELGRSCVRLVTSQGWIEVPFKDLPSDVSSFPEEWRETITDRQASMVKDKPAAP